MEFLFSNYPPIKTGFRSFSDTFYSLIPQSTQLDIAVGYVSSDSLMELKRILELNGNISQLNLIVGMHYFEHFTKVQYKAAMVLPSLISPFAIISRASSSVYLSTSINSSGSRSCIPSVSSVAIYIWIRSEQ